MSHAGVQEGGAVGVGVSVSRDSSTSCHVWLQVTVILHSIESGVGKGREDSGLERC